MPQSSGLPAHAACSPRCAAGGPGCSSGRSRPAADRWRPRWAEGRRLDRNRLLRRFSPPQPPDVNALWARLTGKPGVKPVVPLEFAPAEVTLPVYAAMPILIEFSGPLVAPRTAVIRAKAPGTLLGLRVA